MFECILLEKYVVNSLRGVGMVMSSICLCVLLGKKGVGEKKEVLGGAKVLHFHFPPKEGAIL